MGYNPFARSWAKDGAYELEGIPEVGEVPKTPDVVFCTIYALPKTRNLPTTPTLKFPKTSLLPQ